MINFTKVEGRDCGDIKLFALSTCIWCKKTKAYLNEHNIAYSYVNVDMLSGAEEEECLKEQRKYDKGGTYPVIAIGESECIVGYDRDELDRLSRGME